MTTRDSQWERCGEGTQWGCGEIVVGDARLVLRMRSAVKGGRGMGPYGDAGHVIFHRECLPDVAFVPAFSKGLAAEDAARAAAKP